MDAIIGFAILAFVFAYLAVNINKSTDDDRFKPLIYVFLMMCFIMMVFTSNAVTMSWNATINGTSGGSMFNETTMPRDSGETGWLLSVIMIIILFAFLLIMAIKEGVGITIKLVKGK